MKQIGGRVKLKREKELFLAEITFHNRIISYELVRGYTSEDAKSEICIKFSYPKSWVNIKSVV